MAIKYARLFDPVNQFVRKDGIPNAGGTLNIFYEGTDDRAELRDEDGTVLSNPLSLDADGRALGTFVDSARVYRLEVRDAYGAEQFTVRKMVPCGGGTGSTLGKEYNVVSGDGTVKVTSYVDAGVITFDLSTSYELEGARWGAKLSLLDHIAEADEWQELQAVSTQGSIPYVSGWYPGHAGAFDLAGSVEMVQGVPTAIHTVEVMAALVVGGVQKEVQHGIIDPSLPEQRVSFEFKGATEGEESVDVLYYVRSSETMSIGLAARTWYNDEVDGVVGGGGGSVGYSAGEGIHIDSANVISVTGMLPESASSQFAPSGDYAYNSSLTAYQPTGDYAYNSSLTGYQPTGDYAYNSSLSSKLDASASSQFQPSGDYADASALSSKLDASASSQFQPSGNYQSALTFGYSGGAISSIDGSAIAGMGGHEYTGIYPVIVDNTADTIAVDSTGLSVDETMTAYESGGEVVIGVRAGQFAPTGDYAYNSSLSSKMDTSASSGFYPTGNPSGFITGIDLSDYAKESSVSSKLDASASSEFYSTSNPSGFITGIDLSDYAKESSLSSKMDASASSEFYSTGNPSGFITGVDLDGYATTGYVDSAVSSKLDATASSQFAPSGNYADASSLSSKLDASASSEFYSTGNPSGFITGIDLSEYAKESSLSAKMDASASSEFYPTGNPSGFLTGVDLSDYQLTADMSAYQPSGDYAYNSSLTGYYTTANESGFVDSAYVDSAVSGKQDASAMTAYQDVAGMSAYQPSGDYAYNSSLTAYQPTGDYAYNSSLTAYQPAGDYQPSGDYIYASALGIAEV